MGGCKVFLAFCHAFAALLPNLFEILVSAPTEKQQTDFLSRMNNIQEQLASEVKDVKAREFPLISVETACKLEDKIDVGRKFISEENHLWSGISTLLFRQTVCAFYPTFLKKETNFVHLRFSFLNEKFPNPDDDSDDADASVYDWQGLDHPMDVYFTFSPQQNGWDVWENGIVDWFYDCMEHFEHFLMDYCYKDEEREKDL